MKYIVLLFLGGCATTSLDDLYLQRTACVSSGGECSALDRLIDRKLDIMTLRENAMPPECPDGYVAFCDSRWDRGCGRKYSKKPVDWVCISQEQVRGQLFGR